MSDSFHLDRCLALLDKIEEAGEGNPASARVVHDALQDAGDALAAHATLLARDLLEHDGLRRELLERIERDRTELDYETMARPFRPFWTHPWMIVQNIGLFPFRVAGWLTYRRVREGEDVLEQMNTLRERRRSLQHARSRGASASEIRRLLEEKRGLEHRMAEVREERLAEEFDDLPEACLADGLVRCRRAIGRLGELHDRRIDQQRRVERSRSQVRSLPRASYAELIYAENVSIYRRVLRIVEMLLEEVHLGQNVALFLTRTLQRTIGEAGFSVRSIVPTPT